MQIDHHEVLDMSTRNPSTENDIATAAARVLHNSFITASRSETVLYVVNDTLVSKAPNGQPVMVKRLAGRSTHIAKEFVARGTFKIKKRKVESVAE